VLVKLIKRTDTAARTGHRILPRGLAFKNNKCEAHLSIPIDIADCSPIADKRLRDRAQPTSSSSFFFLFCFFDSGFLVRRQPPGTTAIEVEGRVGGQKF